MQLRHSFQALAHDAAHPRQTVTRCIELTDEQLDQASGALVVPAIIAVLISPLLPSVQKDGMSPDQARQVAAGNPMPRPR